MIITLLTYYLGLTIEKDNKRLKLIIGLLCCFGILLIYKYNFFFANLFEIILRREFNISSLAVPAGISYYIFEATSYIIDIYNKKTKAQHNILKYALFISFFPKLISGPIEKTKDFIEQIDNPHKFDYGKFEEGALLAIWGLFLKIVIADRISIFVNTIYGDINTYTGFYLAFATLAYAFQIYCDFSGYAIMAIGFSKILGIELIDNFNVPYLSISIIDFWKKWHISLTNWLRDYVYIPLGGNRNGKCRKYFNIMIVFLISGMWHGSNINFIIWGAINGFYQIINYELRPLIKKVYIKLNINEGSSIVRILQGIITFLLIDFSWIFFRASTPFEAIQIISSIFHSNNINILFDYSIFTCGIDRGDALILFISLTLLLIAEIKKKNGVCLRKDIINYPSFRKSIIIAAFICFVLLFGKWGPSFDASEFIYAKF